ncbi:MAG TPA: YihY/virulence factor BrkB family protein [Bryobacteraceae bacterium]|nr:YihY/virulence factor BrkB family protein [Bryobacteraceae bacterium]
MITRSEAFNLLRSAAAKWNHYNAPRLGAALAFYALLSLAPLLILAVAICGLVFSRNTVEQDLLFQVEQIAGRSSASVIKALIDNSHQTRSGIVAGISAVLTLFFGASGVLLELRDSLNLIWDTPCRFVGWRGFIWQRLFSFGMVLALGFLLLASLVVSTWFSLVTEFVGGLVPVMVGEVTNAVVSFVAITILFALIFKFVPDADIRWHDVIVGAVLTSIFFGVGRALLTLYLRTAGIGSTYGAAGSLVALVVWVYYSAQIFFFGAVLTRVYADRFGSRSQPVDAQLG